MRSGPCYNIGICEYMSRDTYGALRGWVTSMKIGFDSELYMQKQTEQITERISHFDNKLYLEFGGKIFDDFHASRVLPGFDPNGKIKLLHKLRDKVEVVFCVNAADIEKTKIRADIGITYNMEVIRLIELISNMGILVSSVVITQYTGQPAVEPFRRRLEMMGVRHYTHYPIPEYPANVNLIVSDEGYGKNDYVETTRPLVVVTAPGPGSGKLATCLSQLYHEHKRGRAAGYAKFETFPIWNLPLKHPVNLAYEAATADLQDINMIDPFHLEAYGISTVNYNRDIEAFPVLRAILTRVTGNPDFYRSPTDMGVNMAGYCITDNDACCLAACNEINRRYFKAASDVKLGKEKESALEKIKLIMQQLDLKPEDRPVVVAARQKKESSGSPSVAIELKDGRIVTGRKTHLMSAAASCALNSVKALAGLDDKIMLISPIILEPILHLKEDILGSSSSVLKLDDVLTALSICAATNPTAALAVNQLAELRSCDMHSTQMLRSGDDGTLRKLGITVTTDPVFPANDFMI